MTSRFPPFAFVELVSPYNKKNITRWLEDMNFMFSWQEQYQIHIFSPQYNILYICTCVNCDHITLMGGLTLDRPEYYLPNLPDGLSHEDLMIIDKLPPQQASQGLAEEHGTSKKRERGMMGTSVERERGMMGRKREKELRIFCPPHFTPAFLNN